jgi:DNA polymerase III sliding clamp (beta) subunit (PCNA family)
MKVQSGNFAEIINIVKPSISKYPITDQTDHFCFDTQFVYGFNDRFLINCPFVFDHKIAVPAKELTEMINTIKLEDEFDLEFKNNQLLFTTNTIKAGIKVLTELKLQDIIDSIKCDKWKPLKNDFIEGLKLCYFSASTDSSRGVLNGVFINNDNIISSDDFRISKFKIKSGIGESFLIDLASVQALLEFPKVEKFCLSDNWVSFKTKDNQTLHSRLLVGKYPEVDKFFNFKGTKINFPDTLKPAINDIIYFAEGETDIDKKVKVSIDKDKIVCRGEKEKGWIEKTVPFKFKGKPFEFQTNPIFFSQMISKSLTVTVDKEAILFEMDNFKHVMSLPGE